MHKIFIFHFILKGVQKPSFGLFLFFEVLQIQEGNCSILGVDCYHPRVMLWEQNQLKDKNFNYCLNFAFILLSVTLFFFVGVYLVFYYFSHFRCSVQFGKVGKFIFD